MTGITKLVIVGDRGAMGSYFKGIFSSMEDMCVEGIDRPLTPGVLQSLSHAQMVLLCIPVSAISSFMTRLKRSLQSPKFVLVDICSVKVMPMKVMLEEYPGPVVGTHPLFGPSPSGEKSLRIAMVRGRGDGEFEEVKRLFSQAGFEPFECSATEHDRALAFIQALNFVTTLSYFAAFSGDSSLLKFITPSFCRRLSAAKKMLTQDCFLFEQLFEANPYSHEAVKRFRSFLNLASAGDIDLLVEKAWWWWQKGKEEGEGVP